MVAELLDSHTVAVSENMDLTDSSIAQLYVSTTRSDATTYIGSNHQDDGSVSINVKSRDKIKYTA